MRSLWFEDLCVTSIRGDEIQDFENGAIWHDSVTYGCLRREWVSIILRLEWLMEVHLTLLVYVHCAFEEVDCPSKIFLIFMWFWIRSPLVLRFLFYVIYVCLYMGPCSISMILLSPINETWLKSTLALIISLGSCCFWCSSSFWLASLIQSAISLQCN